MLPLQFILRLSGIALCCGYLILTTGCSSGPIVYQKGFDVWKMEFNGGKHPKQLAFYGMHPQWAPGTKDMIAFVQPGVYVGHGPYNAIFTMDYQGNKLTRITDWTAGKNFTWSFDRGWIAFEKYQQGLWKIFKMRVDGSDETQLTTGPSNDVNPKWAPANKNMIAFESDRRQGDWDIWIMSDDGSNLQNLTGSGFGDGKDSKPSWSPDGNLLAYLGEHINFGGGRRVYVAKPHTSWGGPFSPISLFVEDIQPMWSWESDQIFYVVKANSVEPPIKNFHLYKQPLDSVGQNAQKLSESWLVAGDYFSVDDLVVWYSKSDDPNIALGVYTIDWRSPGKETRLDDGVDPCYSATGR